MHRTDLKTHFTDGELEIILRLTHLMLARRLGERLAAAALPLTTADLRQIHRKLDSLFNLEGNK